MFPRRGRNWAWFFAYFSRARVAYLSTQSWIDRAVEPLMKELSHALQVVFRAILQGPAGIAPGVARNASRRPTESCRPPSPL